MDSWRTNFRLAEKKFSIWRTLIVSRNMKDKYSIFSFTSSFIFSSINYQLIRLLKRYEDVCFVFTYLLMLSYMFYAIYISIIWKLTKKKYKKTHLHYSFLRYFNCLETLTKFNKCTLFGKLSFSSMLDLVLNKPLIY